MSSLAAGSHAAPRNALSKIRTVGMRKTEDYSLERWIYPPRRIMSKKSRLFLLAFILSSMNSIASISSML